MTHHIISGISFFFFFFSRFDWPDHISAYLLLIAFDSDVTMMQKQASMNMPEFPNIQKERKKKNNNRKTKITSNSCRALGKIWLKIRSETIIIGWTSSYLNSSGRIQSWFRPQTYLTSRFKCCSVVSIIFQFKSK